MGIYACGGCASRGLERAVMGMRPWGYMHAGAMEVEILKGAVMGMSPWGYMHAGAMEVEAVRRLSWGGGHGGIGRGM